MKVITQEQFLESQIFIKNFSEYYFYYQNIAFWER